MSVQLWNFLWPYILHLVSMWETLLSLSSECLYIYLSYGLSMRANCRHSWDEHVFICQVQPQIFGETQICTWRLEGYLSSKTADTHDFSEGGEIYFGTIWCDHIVQDELLTWTEETVDILVVKMSSHLREVYLSGYEQRHFDKWQSDCIDSCEVFIFFFHSRWWEACSF